MLQTAVSRVKTLEESIEAERAAHLESKFNSEIIQVAASCHSLTTDTFYPMTDSFHMYYCLFAHTDTRLVDERNVRI